MDTETTTLLDQFTMALMPSGLQTFETIPVAPSAYREMAEMYLDVLRRVLQNHPRLLVELGWQRIAIGSEGDNLNRGRWLYAPPIRTYD